MKARGWFIAAILLIFTGFSIAAIVTYKYYRLNSAYKSSMQEFDDARIKEKILKTKYMEEKAKAVNYQRTAQFAESQRLLAEKKVEQVEAEKAGVVIEREKLEKKLIMLDKHMLEYDERLQKHKEQWEELVIKYKDAQKTMKMRDTKIENLENEIQGLKADLQYANRTAQRYLEHNKKMAQTAKSILNRDAEGIFESINKIEPFTELNKVELEHLIQSYLDDLDSHELRERQ